MIGAAHEFWRLRLVRLDTTEGFDFEWHDDILYREPQVDQGDEVEIWHVEAVELESADTAVRLHSFADRESAEAYRDRVQEDLSDMTKGQFEKAYVAPCSEDAAP